MAKKDLAKTESTELTVAADLGEWGEEQEVSSNDLVIPKLWLMQSLSEMVADKELAKAGDLVDSLSEDVLGTEVSLCPFKVEKLWYTIKDNGDRGELVSIDPITKDNEGLPREYEQGGEKFKRMYTYKFFFVREGSDLPIIAVFKSTSLRAGKQLFTEMFVKNRMAGKSPAARMVTLSSEKQKNDKGTYYVFKVKMGGDTSADLHTKALQWFKTLKVESYVESGDDAVASADSDNAAEY